MKKVGIREIHYCRGGSEQEACPLKLNRERPCLISMGHQYKNNALNVNSVLLQPEDVQKKVPYALSPWPENISVSS